MYNKLTKNLISFGRDFLKITILIYIIVISILFYMGPLETKIVKRQLKKHPVDIIVSLASTPYRINTIKPVLDSIFRQSIKPTRVYLNLPLKSLVYPNKEFIIPDWLKKYPNIIINRTEQDYGPATKLIPTLKKELNPNTIIITVDDDRLYPKHIIRDLIKKKLPGLDNNHQKEFVTTGVGECYLIEPKNLILYPLHGLANNKSLTADGSYAIAYKRKFFNNDIFSLFDNLSMDCFLSDDIMIPSYLAANNIDIINSYNGSFSYNQVTFTLGFKELPTAYANDSIKMGANGNSKIITYERTRSCLARLPYLGKGNYSQAFFKQSKIISSSYTNASIFFDILKCSYYAIFMQIINIMPGIKQLFIYAII